MIKFKPVNFDKLIEANCDSCGDKIKLDVVGNLTDHVMIGGKKDGLSLEAIVCIKCMEEKMSFINIQKKNNRIGYC